MKHERLVGGGGGGGEKRMIIFEERRLYASSVKSLVSTLTKKEDLKPSTVVGRAGQRRGGKGRVKVVFLGKCDFRGRHNRN